MRPSRAAADDSGGAVSLPEWVLQISVLLAGAVLLGVLARRVRLQLTVVLAIVGFLAAWLGGR